jgi:hypothetical protein
MRSVIVVVVALGIAACSSSSSSGPVIHASDYDQSCSVSTDCATVSEGAVCGCGSCPNASVNRNDQQRFLNDYASLHGQCSGPPQGCPAIYCPNPPVECKAGVCTLCGYGGCSSQDAGAADAADAAKSD